MTPDAPADDYADRAAAYAVHRPSYPPALVDFLADLTAQHTLAWDAGCGSGQLSVLLVARFERVVATDASAGQLAHARRQPNVLYRRARAETSGLPNGEVDLAVAAQAAHWFDLPAYYAEVRRVTRPGGVVALVTYGRMTVGDDVDPVIGAFYEGVLGRYWSPERRHVEQGYRSLPFPFEELAAPALEMRADWSAAQVLAYVDTWSAVRAMVRAEGSGPLGAFRRDLSRAWRAGTVRRVTWPLAVRVGRA
ncbi:MAG: class I SAM-dependent methyltransferase [Gemmatimonadales bacterium]